MRHKLRAATDSYRNRLQRLLCEHAAALSDWRDLHLTPEQLHRLNEEIAAVVERYAASQSAGDNAERVIVQLQSFPRRS